jgi:AcrR family transcriptional regulator
MSNSKDKILKVAKGLFSQKGYKVVSVREIAALAGVNVSMVSYYFGSKEGLYRAIIETHFDKAKELFEKLQAPAQQALSNRNNFFQFWRIFLNHVIDLKIENQNVEEMLIYDFIQGLPFSYEIHKKYFPAMVKDLERLIEYGKANKWIKTEVNSFVFLAMLISGIDMFLMMGRKRGPFQKTAKKIIEDRHTWIHQMLLIYFEGVSV